MQILKLGSHYDLAIQIRATLSTIDPPEWLVYKLKKLTSENDINTHNVALVYK